jgi:hypothetical protein
LSIRFLQKYFEGYNFYNNILNNTNDQIYLSKSTTTIINIQRGIVNSIQIQPAGSAIFRCSRRTEQRKEEEERGRRKGCQKSDQTKEKEILLLQIFFLQFICRQDIIEYTVCSAPKRYHFQVIFSFSSPKASRTQEQQGHTILAEETIDRLIPVTSTSRIWIQQPKLG